MTVGHILSACVQSCSGKCLSLQWSCEEICSLQGLALLIKSSRVSLCGQTAMESPWQLVPGPTLSRQISLTLHVFTPVSLNFVYTHVHTLQKQSILYTYTGEKQIKTIGHSIKINRHNKGTQHVNNYACMHSHIFRAPHG